MLDFIPSAEEMRRLVGESRYDIWHKLDALIVEKYDKAIASIVSR